MNKDSFEKFICDVKISNPNMFALEPDQTPTIKELELIEAYYDLKLPGSYKDFLLHYGGGYFVFTVVYSIDKESPFYIKRNVQRDFVAKMKFLPVIDFETGDTVGFRVNNGVCGETMSIFDHEEKSLRDLSLNFYDVLIQYGLNTK